jgi:spore photoproduct lyase
MHIERLLVDRDLVDHPRVARFASALRLNPETIDGPDKAFAAVTQEADPVAAGKRTLHLTRQRGAFVRNCPGTRAYTCCGYKILNPASFCTMDCAYCILQAYFHPPLLQFFLNAEEMYAELDRLLGDGLLHRVGTGEFTDSLLWDLWTDLSPPLVERFAGQSRSVLELKTKTVNIAHLKGLAHNRKTILSWSLNTPRVIAAEERGTAPLTARLEAAQRAGAWGYPLAFHFDPMVIYPGCEAEYTRVVDDLLQRVSADKIVWISMGTFRFIPALKALIAKRFPRSKLIYGEFIGGLDGKQRYFKPHRLALYRSMVDCIRARAPELCLYMCMEDDVAWRKAFGFVPQEHGGLPAMLDAAARRCCDLEGSPP